MSERNRENVRRHLDACPDCAKEFKALEKILLSAGSLGREMKSMLAEELEEPVGKMLDFLSLEMKSVLAGIDWDAQAEKIVSAVWDEKKRPQRKPKPLRLWTFLPRLRPVLAGLLIGIMVGGVGMFVAYRGGLFEKPKGEALFASREFLDRVDQEMARRETLNYLDKSQYVLLELARTQSGSGDCRLTDAAVRETKELLAKKKYLNPQLEKVRMAKAKEICDQIEMLFYELAQVSESLTPAQCRGIQNMIEEKNIILKIKLLKKDLQESEV
jgi:hypothetical protein